MFRGPQKSPDSKIRAPRVNHALLDQLVFLFGPGRPQALERWGEPAQPALDPEQQEDARSAVGSEVPAQTRLPLLATTFSGSVTSTARYGRG